MRPSNRFADLAGWWRFAALRRVTAGGGWTIHPLDRGAISLLDGGPHKIACEEPHACQAETPPARHPGRQADRPAEAADGGDPLGAARAGEPGRAVRRLSACAGLR